MTAAQLDAALGDRFRYPEYKSVFRSRGAWGGQRRVGVHRRRARYVRPGFTAPAGAARDVLTDSTGVLVPFGVDFNINLVSHAGPSMTRDVYVTRGKLHTEVAEALNEAVSGALPLHEQAIPTQK